MDDKTPTPDQTPETTGFANDAGTAPTPDATHVPTTEQATAAPIAAAPAEPKPRRRRALVIGGGIVAALVLAGGGVAVGAAIGDEFGEDDDHLSMSEEAQADDGQADDDRGERGDDDPEDGAQDTGSDAADSASAIGTDSADELIAIAEAARGASDGEVTSIDAKRDATWEVQLTTGSGDETEVRVDADGAAEVIGTEPADGEDSAPTLTLDDDTIRALVTAALDEADGRITDLDVDGDDASPYDVSVLTADNRSVDIDLGADFAVVGTDTDE